MKNAIKALMIDWMKFVGRGTLFVSGMFVIGPWLFYQLFLRPAGVELSGAQSADSPFQFPYYYTYFAMAIVNTAATAGMMAVRVAKRNRVQPVSTNFLAGWNLFAIAGTVIVFNLMTQCVYWLIFGCDWPILSTTIAMSSMSVVLASTCLWLRDCRIHRFLPAAVWVVGWCYWCLLAMHGGDFSNSISDQAAWAATFQVGVVLAWVVSWLLMKSGCHHYRRGAELDGRLLLVFTDPASLLERRDDEPDAVSFGDSRQAFLKMDWQRNRVRLYGTTFAFSLAFGILFCVMTCSDLQGMNALPMILLFAAAGPGFLVGTLSAAGVRSQISLEVSPFLSTLPVTDRMLGRRFMGGLLRSSVFYWSVLMATVPVALLLGFLVSSDEPFASKITQTTAYEVLGPAAFVVIPAACLILACVACGLGASFSLSLHGFMAVCAVGMMFVWSILTAAASAGIPGAKPMALLGLFVFAVLICGGGTLRMAAKAKRRKLLTAVQANSMIVLGLSICVLVWLLLPLDWYWKSIAAGASMILVLPLASIPTTLANCRHT